MSEVETVHDEGDAPGDLPGVVAELGELPAGAVVTEAALARIFRRHRASIRRAVARGELPRPVRLLGGPCWTVGVILAHLERRLATAAREAGKDAARISRLSP